MCTNNENNICEEVTYKRMLNIQSELPHNLKYFKTDFLYKADEEADKLEQNILDYPNLKGIYVSKNILLTSSQGV